MYIGDAQTPIIWWKIPEQVRSMDTMHLFPIEKQRGIYLNLDNNTARAELANHNHSATSIVCHFSKRLPI